MDTKKETTRMGLCRVSDFTRVRIDIGMMEVKQDTI